MPKLDGYALAVLIVEDDGITLERHRVILESAALGQEVLTLERGKEALPLLRRRDVGVVLLDLTLPDASGEELLAAIKEEQPQVQVIIVTAADDVATAVRCMKAGAFNYLSKPVEPAKLVTNVKNALELRTLEIENRLLADRLMHERLPAGPAFRTIVTRNDAMLRIFKYIDAIARSPKVVLITGETGTGKELIARAVHEAGGRSGGFHAVNAAEFDEAMFSDAIFGHRKGAFTGAEDRRRGLLETAGEGTLFLDEIGDLSPRVQVKLLRLIESGEFYALGSDTPSRSGARIVAATNRPLEAAVAAGSFRRDLFYRLSVHRIHLPPLRDRKEDLPLLVDHFVKRASLELGLQSCPVHSPALLQKLAAYDYPGNIRELEAMIFDAVSRSAGRCLDSDDLFPTLAGPAEASEPSVPGLAFPKKLPTAREARDTLYAEALRRSGGNQSAAARLIGISQQTLSAWVSLRTLPEE